MVTRAAVEGWERSREEKRIRAWGERGLLDTATTARLLAAARGEPVPPPAAAARPAAPAVEPALERGATRATDALVAFSRLVAARAAGLLASLDADEAPPPVSDAAGSRIAATDAARAVFGGSAAVGGGLEALEELDHPDAEGGEARPLGALQVFWFVGALLVLAGSLMGVREAWRTFEGALRPLSIAGALFAYHLAFVGLAHGLARRSAVTGRVLGIIATGLLPVAAVAVAVALGMSRAAALAAALVLLASAAGTLTLLGARVFPGMGLTLPAALLPALALELPLAPGEPATSTRLALASAALVPVAVAASWARASRSPRAPAALAASLYGAVAVGVLAIFGGPSDASLELSRGVPSLAAPAWFGVFASLLWWAGSAPERGLAARLGGGAVPVAVVSLALLTGAAVGGAVASLSQGASQLTQAGAASLAPCLVLLLASAALLLEPRARGLAVHAAVPLAHLGVFVGARALRPEAPVSTWLAACASVPAALLLLSPLAVGRGRRLAVPIWAVLEGLAVLVGTALGQALEGQRGTYSTTALAAVVLALAAHGGGRTAPRGRPWLHLFGGLALLVAATAWWLPTRPEPTTEVLGWLLAALAALYGAAGLAYGLLSGDSDDRPLDDVSLFALLAGVGVSALGTNAPAGFASTWLELEVGARRAAPLLPLVLLLALRSFRDASALPSVVAGLALGAFGHLATGAWTDAEGTLVAACAAGLLLLPASLRASTPGEPPFGRAVLGLVPLPLGARGRAALDGFGLAAALLALLAFARGASWIAARGGGADGLDPAGLATESGRVLVVFGLGAATLFWLGAFSTRGLERASARGRVVTLALAGLGVALAAVSNRVGHPLPPEVVGRNLTLILSGVWVAARLFVRGGPRVAGWLGRPEQGPHYQYVPHAGVLALSALLLYDVWAVGGQTLARLLHVTPPLFFFGAGLGMLLLYRSSGGAPFLHLGLASWLGFAATASAQRAMLGPALVALDAPGGRWVPLASAARSRADWLDPALFLPPGLAELALQDRALFGGALFATATAALFASTARSAPLRHALGHWVFARGESTHEGLSAAFAHWTTAVACSLGGLLLFQPSLPAAALVVGAGAVALLAPGPAHRGLALQLGAPLVLHSAAHLPAVLGGAARAPTWAGPALAALALLPAGAAWLHRRRHAGSVLPLALAPVTLSYGAFALVYALGVFAPMSPLAALPALLAPASPLPAGTAAGSFSLASTLGLLSVATALSAWSFRGGLAAALSVAAPLALAGSAAALAARLTFSTPDAVWPGLLLQNGALLGATLASAAGVAHGLALGLARAQREDAASGARLGRDAVLLAASAVLSVFIALRAPGGLEIARSGLVAFALAFVVALHVAARERTARHVALAELLVVALYAFVTDELPLRPEVHALLGLGYGFTLLGVAVVARRLAVPSVSQATRVVLAALPVVVGLLTARGPSNQAALIALGGSVLYGAVGLTERSRIFGSLAATLANLALLVFALAQGLDGVEVYVGPLGILVAMLSQVFAPKLTKGARSALRVLGGALLYLPSGLRLVVELGSSRDATYSVIFGALCLVGLAAGLVLQVRAYLALGALFLTLDVLANLVFVGLRDHRVGFLLLSTTGLLIIGIMIAVTLRREAARALLARLRARLGAWD